MPRYQPGSCCGCGGGGLPCCPSTTPPSSLAVTLTAAFGGSVPTLMFDAASGTFKASEYRQWWRTNISDGGGGTCSNMVSGGHSAAYWTWGCTQFGWTLQLSYWSNAICLAFSGSSANVSPPVEGLAVGDTPPIGTDGAGNPYRTFATVNLFSSSMACTRPWAGSRTISDSNALRWLYGTDTISRSCTWSE